MIDLKLDSVSKRYLISDESRRDDAAHPLLRKLRALKGGARSEFWAVRDVSFAVERGESLGIIGHNGAGKSTLLKLLSGITAPTSGEITINGRLSALIEVGSGFHPELTGRENAYLSGSILGMTRREITNKLEAIVEFAGLRQFIDTPVKRYSSGMYVRLGFSIAAHLDPDILLLDEVLAVGDSAFQAKCLARIAKLKQAGTTIVFISHDLKAVESFCDRAILMERGRVAADARPAAVIAEYQSRILDATPQANPARTDDKAQINSVTICDADKRKVLNLCTGDSFTLHVDYIAHEYIEDAIFDVYLNREEGSRELHCQLTAGSDGETINLEPGAGSIEFKIESLGLRHGIYHVDATIRRRETFEDVTANFHCAVLHVDPSRIMRGGVFYMPYQWRAGAPSIFVEDDADDYAGVALNKVGASR